MRSYAYGDFHVIEYDGVYSGGSSASSPPDTTPVHEYAILCSYEHGQFPALEDDLYEAFPTDTCASTQYTYGTVASCDERETEFNSVALEVELASQDDPRPVDGFNMSRDAAPPAAAQTPALLHSVGNLDDSEDESSCSSDDECTIKDRVIEFPSRKRRKTNTNLEEILTYRISYLLPSDKLPGVIEIINPSEECGSQQGQELVIDLSSIPQSKLLELHEYVERSIQETSKPKKTTKKKVQKLPKTPKQPGAFRNSKQPTSQPAKVSDKISSPVTSPQTQLLPPLDEDSDEEIDVVGL